MRPVGVQREEDVMHWWVWMLVAWWVVPIVTVGTAGLYAALHDPGPARSTPPVTSPDGQDDAVPVDAST